MFIENTTAEVMSTSLPTRINGPIFTKDISNKTVKENYTFRLGAIFKIDGTTLDFLINSSQEE